MIKSPVWIALVFLGIALSAAGAAATPSAQPAKVRGTQIVIDEKKGIYEMKGSLVGKWNVTAFTPRYQSASEFAGTGTERFQGCHDLDRGGGCDAGEPAGTIRFTFMYWASFNPRTEAS